MVILNEKNNYVPTLICVKNMFKIFSKPIFPIIISSFSEVGSQIQSIILKQSQIPLIDWLPASILHLMNEQAGLKKILI